MRNEMTIGFLTAVILLVPGIILLGTEGSAEEDKIIHVGPYGDHSTIQGGIDAASDGYKILVDDGTYHENLTIYDDLVIESINGSGKTRIVGTNMTAVRVQSDHFHMKGFNISGGSVKTNFSDHNTGIELLSTHIRLGFTIEDCVIEGFGKMAIKAQSARYVKILNSTIISEKNGIAFSMTSDSIISNCVVRADDTGITLDGGGSNIIENCTVSRSETNLEVFLSEDNTIAYNNISYGSRHGLHLYYYADNNLVIGNDFYKNDEYAVEVSLCSGNIVLYNNFYSNNNGGVQATDNMKTQWDDGIHGNFWSDYRSRYPGANTTSNGTYDVGYTMVGDGTDNHPLVKPFIVSSKPRIIIDTESMTFFGSRKVNITLKAIDMDTDPEDLVWKVSSNASWLAIKDGDRLFGAPKNKDIGSYWVNISVTDGKGTDWSNFTLYVIEKPDNSLPRITSKGPSKCYEDKLLFHRFEAIHNYTVTWGLATNASFLDLDANTGWLNGTPSNDDVGSYWVNVTVSGVEGVDHLNFTLTVINTNDPPEITTSDVTTWNSTGDYSVDYNATDIDPTNDQLTWSLETNATDLGIVASTGVLSWGSSDPTAGSFWVNVTVSDRNGGMDFSNFTLTITVKSAAALVPMVVFDPPRAILENGDKLTVEVSNMDLDDLIIIWYIDGIGEIGRGSSIDLSLEDGDYILKVNVTYGSGKWIEEAYPITVESRNGDTEGLDTGVLIMILALVFILFVVLILSVFIVRRRRHQLTAEITAGIDEGGLIGGPSKPGSIGMSPESDLRLGSLDPNGSRSDTSTRYSDVLSTRRESDFNDPDEYLFGLEDRIIRGEKRTRKRSKTLMSELERQRENGKISREAYDLAMEIVEE